METVGASERVVTLLCVPAACVQILYGTLIRNINTFCELIFNPNCHYISEQIGSTVQI